MRKIKSTINLLKTMLQTSYDTSAIIDKETKKLNKKSIKVWLLVIIAFLVTYLSYKLINWLAGIGAETIFLETFMLILQIIVLLQTIILSISVMYFAEDIPNYLYLPISNIKLFVTKFVVMMSIIFGTELIVILPSLYMYGARIIEKNELAYYVLLVLILFLISIFLGTVVLIVMIPIMRIFRFIKNKYWYQTVVVAIMTLIIFTPIGSALLKEKPAEENINISESTVYEEDNEELEQMRNIKSQIESANKYFIVGKLGVEALSVIDTGSLINVLKILGLNIIALTVLLIIGKFTYIKDLLWSLSLLQKKKNVKIDLNKKCKVKNKKKTFVMNDIKDILKNSTFFMHYIYNVFIILFIIIMIAISIIPIFKQFIIENIDSEIDYSFDFEMFSIIIGIIQLIFTIAPISLTEISRYGKNAIFFKYIPIKQETQFRLKNIPQLIRNTIIIIVVIATIHYLFPEITINYLILMFVIGMLLNIINSYILLLIDVKRPQLNSENEVSVVEQNDNKIFKYVVTICICVILWYLYKATEELSLNMSILIEIIVFSVVLLILEVIIAKNKEELFKNIM